jgi:Mg2+/Co2+ transporter CorB
MLLIILFVLIFLSVLHVTRVSTQRIHKATLTSLAAPEAVRLKPEEQKNRSVSLLDLGQATVEDIMIPKSEIIGLDLDQPWLHILEQLEAAQHTQLPIYHGDIDRLIGLIHMRQVLRLALEDKLDREHLIHSADAPYFIPEATALNIQILNFRKSKKSNCFVVDEYGDILGLVTLEDILAELIGEFTSESAGLSRDITLQGDGSVIIDASLTIRHLNRMLNWNLPLVGPRTLSGLIVEYLGYIPPADSCLMLKEYRIEILKISDNMIKNVKIIKVDKN